MQISKKSIMADFSGVVGCFVEHTEVDLCVKFQVSLTHSVRGVVFPKLHFSALVTAPTHISWEAFAYHFQLLGRVSWFYLIPVHGN